MPTDTVPDTPLTGVSLPTEELACSVPTLAEPETSPCPPTVTEPVTLRVPTEVVEAGSVLVIVSLATDPVVDKDRVADPEIPTVEIESRLADAPKVPKEAAPETGFTGVSLPTTLVVDMDSVALPDRGLTGVCLPTVAEAESAREAVPWGKGCTCVSLETEPVAPNVPTLVCEAGTPVTGVSFPTAPDKVSVPTGVDEAGRVLIGVVAVGAGAAAETDIVAEPDTVTVVITLGGGAAVVANIDAELAGSVFVNVSEPTPPVVENVPTEAVPDTALTVDVAASRKKIPKPAPPLVSFSSVTNP